MWKPVLFSLTTLSAVCLTEALNILLIAPTCSKSHAILHEGIIKHLTRAGHEVTYIAVIPPEKPMTGVTVIDISDLCPLSEDFLNVNSMLEKRFDINEYTGFLPLIVDGSYLTIEHPKVQKLMFEKSQQYDLVIAEFLFNTVFAGFSGLYNCPLIWFSPTSPNWMVFELVDEATNPAYSVGAISSSTPPLTFRERVVELASYLTRKLLQILWTSRLDKAVYEKNFAPLIRERWSTVPSLDTLVYNGSLVLGNSHTSLSVPYRTPQNYISIGGFHIDENIAALPQDLQKIMDDAKHGVIYFCLGTNIKSKHFPSEIKQDFLKIFSKLNQTVIWKFEVDLPNRPKNVHIVQWAPQQSILAHNNCILFITHGGLLSATETIHFGVPTIGIPAFYDQFANVNRAVAFGYAKRVDLSYAIAKDLETAIEDVLNDPKYTTRVHELSEIYHDRTVPPAKELIHWVEHVAKRGGAPHLRSPAFMVPWYQKLYLDFYLILLILVLVLRFTLKFMLRLKISIRKQKVC